MRPTAEDPAIGLRAVTPDDYDFIRQVELASSLRLGGLDRDADEDRDAMTFATDLWRGAHAHRLIYRVSDSQRIGLVTSYNHSPKHRTAWLAVMADDEVLPRGGGLAGLALFVTWLFDEFDLRMLYAETDAMALGDNFARMLTLGGIQDAGRLVNDKLIAGTEVDTILIAIDRDEWNQGFGRLVRARARRTPAHTWPLGDLGLRPSPAAVGGEGRR